MSIPWRLLRFAWVGIAATLVHALAYGILHRLGLPPLAANLVAFAAALPVSYLGQRRWVFRAAGGSPWRFILLQLGGLGLNSGWVALVRASGLPPDAAIAGMILVTPGLAYLAAGRWVFPDRSTPACPEAPSRTCCPP